MDNNTTIYLLLQLFSVPLLLFLFVHCTYHSINFLLQIFSIVAILNNINESVLPIYYNDQVMSQAYGTTGCTVSAIFGHYIPIVLNLLAACMGFNVWLLIVHRSKYKERQLLPWYCLFSFGVPLVMTIIAIILLRNEPHWAANSRRYCCDFQHTSITTGTFAIPMLAGGAAGVLFTMHTAIHLVQYYYKKRQNSNSSGASHRTSIINDLR
ncbi:hypothetical protein BCR41DRAFT_184490 [Lobosporangium transversale]|uniref:G-protein coupled receptors family 1 profile domain-containing protein n=1 Tax=Lobosporangium transversale TaxID=64571 RepID=A0A1Y2GXW3_9FUNG|nr:hypothetical protein BCR41DRAFT_184490 [Lobosporangium transversale]ORZ27140.1 hypothetical protein BCR41DRAFT_184490 [Lobosporangium transversale]|eukprot:XP_021884887.1 hypothetical protein BCR41DRAFT_184490 [Lobosporangium transversale]